MLKLLHVNLFEMNCVSHIVHGMWGHPDNNRHRFNDIGFWTELAALVEHGLFDAVFLADVIGAYDTFRGSVDVAVREGMQIPSNDPLLVVPAMAAVTRHVGFGVTFSTTYEPPFAFARRMSTLDHLTRGRMGWNIVTSYLPNAARNFGHDGEVAHDRRYEIADEYMDVVYKLWEGSWDEDAVRVDRERRVYADPAGVRPIDHKGTFFRVAGPHLCAPSPQRTPVLFQASGSPAGVEFGGRHAEVMFVGGATPADVRANIAVARARAAAHGRDGDAMKFIVQAGVIVGRTDADVADKLRDYRRLFSVEASLAHAQSAIDLPGLPPDLTLADLVARGERGVAGLLKRFTPDTTVGDMLDQLGGFHEGRFFVAGTPGVVADEIERWLDDDGIDGINLRQYMSFGTIRDFVELLVPELQRRGRYRTSYRDNETLRERLFGGGRLLPASHPAARYRDPAALRVPAQSLRFA